MNPWIIIAIIGALAVFVLDLILRKKKWKNNTRAEKMSLLLDMFFVSVYIFASILGMFWGIVGGGSDNFLAQKVYDVTLVMAQFIWVAALAAIISSFVLRKVGKTKASILVNVFTLVYIVLVFAINYLVDLI